MWFQGAHYQLRPARPGVCVRGSLSMSECARVRVDARLSPAQEARCVSVEVEG